MYCPTGSSAPSQVLVGYYGVHAGPQADLKVRTLDEGEVSTPVVSVSVKGVGDKRSGRRRYHTIEI